MKRVCWIGLVVAILLAKSVTAQDTGSIHGRVLDPTIAVIPRVRIEVSRGDLRLVTLTDDVGTFHLDGLEMGDYELVALREGFQRFRLVGIHVAVGETKALPDIPLQVGGSCGPPGPYFRLSHDPAKAEIEVHLLRLPYSGRPPVDATNVEVQVTEATGQIFRGKTNSLGVFSLTNLEPDIYLIQVGYVTTDRVLAGWKTVFDIWLPPEICPETGCDEAHPQKSFTLSVCE
jgi:hypothetical protein